MEGVTIITDARVLTCDPRTQSGRLSIVIRNGRIADLSPNGRLLLSLYPGSQVIDASKKLVIPGFVNAHFQTESLLLRDFTLGRHLSLWGQDVRIRERLARLVRHGTVDDVLDPVVGRFHQAGIIAGVVVGSLFVPVEASGHRKNMTQGDAFLAVVHVLDFGNVEIVEQGSVETRFEVAPCDCDA